MASFQVPPLGESIVEATVSRWLKQVGDAVAAGETLVELETDKITVEVPALEAGTLTAQSRQEGDVVNVGDVLGEVAAGAGAAATPSAPVAEAPAAASAAPASPATAAASDDPKASPAARRLAGDAHLSCHVGDWSAGGDALHQQQSSRRGELFVSVQ